MNNTSTVFAPSSLAQPFIRPTIRVISRATSDGAAEEATTTARFVFRRLRSFGPAFPHGQ